MRHPPPDLLEQVLNATEGEEVEQQIVHLADGSQKTIERRYFGPDRWIRSVRERGILTPLQLLAIVHFALVNFDDRDQDERRIVDGWYRAILDAAENRVIVPRDRDSLLRIESINDWNNWVLSMADADAFVASVGMEWTCAEVAAHLFNESFPEPPVESACGNAGMSSTAEQAASDAPNRRKSNGPKLTDEQRKEIVALDKAGETQTAIAKKLGVTRQAIKKVLDKEKTGTSAIPLQKVWSNRRA